MKPQVVLDSSALIASFLQEKGCEKVDNAIANGAAISTVNLAEVYSKIVSEGWNLQYAISNIKALGLVIHSFEEDEAKICAELYSVGKSLGLSLGDRACLGLGLKLGLPILTADKTWSKLNLEIDIRILR
jgi:PIN domain nuclease of toxin-antitoxin system